MASFEAIEVLLQLLPKGTNPYPYILQAVQHEVYPTAKNSFFIQLYIIAAMDLLVVLLCLLSLGAHYYKGTFWIFRVKSSTNGNFIISNGVLGWQIPGAVFYIGAIVYIAKSIQHLEGNYVPGLATLSFLVWIPAFFAVSSSSQVYQRKLSYTYLDSIGLVCTYQYGGWLSTQTQQF